MESMIPKLTASSGSMNKSRSIAFSILTIDFPVCKEYNLFSLKQARKQNGTMFNSIIVTKPVAKFDDLFSVNCNITRHPLCTSRWLMDHDLHISMIIRSACPRHKVFTFEWMYCIVSNIASPDVTIPPGLLIYRTLSLLNETFPTRSECMKINGQTALKSASTSSVGYRT
ncbi:unnamed protein product [Albugo candida]|uniref:Uncharacterized protein n=1 Tax=Albugo candida TaxID=65357 RepID=A0A024GQ53_9STRA|nr:unnamed protein product [Albugo candida]|eukprot:CCI48865.1 unnamed protein product [Albugo candida]